MSVRLRPRLGPEPSTSAPERDCPSANALAAERFVALSPPAANERGRRRQLAAVIKVVAEDLANTPAIARKSYIHSVVEMSFRDGVLPAALKRVRAAPFRSRAETLVGRLAAESSRDRGGTATAA
jgi:DNA topoisomerase-1